MWCWSACTKLVPVPVQDDFDVIAPPLLVERYVSSPATKSFEGVVGSTAPVRSYQPWLAQKFVVVFATQVTDGSDQSVVWKMPSEEYCPFGHVVAPFVVHEIRAYTCFLSLGACISVMRPTCPGSDGKPEPTPLTSDQFVPPSVER